MLFILKGECGVSNVKKNKVDSKKKQLIRAMYSIVCLVLAFASASVMWKIYNYQIGNENAQVIKQIVIVGGLFTVTYWFFVKMYQGNKIGVYRLTELTYFQLLSFGMADALMVLASMLWFRKLSFGLILITIVVMLIQVLVNSMMIFVFNRIWRKYDEPQKIVIVYGEEGYRSILNKMKVQNLRYNVKACYSDTSSMDEIKKDVDLCDRVYLYKVNNKVRHDLVMYCNRIKRDIYLSREIEDLITMGYDISHSFDTPFIRTSRNRVKWYYPIVKRAADILLSGIAIVALSPVMLLVAIAIKLYDRGPVLYSQIRLTEGHKEFKIYKFRSMITDAEKHGARLASQNDSRITPVGKIIRATRLDELPQLFNIFLGNMSIVGPRPERPEIEKQYLEVLPEFGLRLQVKAGLTGYAQVFGKYNTTPEDKLKLDLLYINQRSLALDLKLILYTIKILFIAESTEGIDEMQTTALNDKCETEK